MSQKHILGASTEVEIIVNMDLTNKSIYKWEVTRPDDSYIEIEEPECYINDIPTGACGYHEDSEIVWTMGGIYKIHIFIQLSDGKHYPSELYEHRVYERGEK